MTVLIKDVYASDLSSLEYGYRLASLESDPSREYLVVAFSGEYRDGSEGRADADFMSGAIHNACMLWSGAAIAGIVIDLSRLRYDWGDDIEGVFENPMERGCAVVVGPECDEALGSLWFGFGADVKVTNKEDVFDDLPSAIAYLGAGSKRVA